MLRCVIFSAFHVLWWDIFFLELNLWLHIYSIYLLSKSWRNLCPPVWFWKYENVWNNKTWKVGICLDWFTIIDLKFCLSKFFFLILWDTLHKELHILFLTNKSSYNPYASLQCAFVFKIHVSIFNHFKLSTSRIYFRWNCFSNG